MSFVSLSIRFQSAGMIPAPYTHFYELTARPAGMSGLYIDFSITYTDREELDEEDITGEGFTLNDDFAWSGKLGAAWLPVVHSIVSTTKLGPFDETKLGEKDDFLEVTIDTGYDDPMVGTPTQAEPFLYAIQELIQAIYEAGGKEKPFELSYLSFQRSGDSEVHLQAQFATRTVKLITIQKGQETHSALPWEQLRTLMGVVFAHDYIPGEGTAKPPKRDGHYLDVGGDEWYDIGPLDDVHEALSALLV
ncbi:hypothetical protein [Fibrella forsythiae]|uniref:Uncharacterized protein n=1 Tax=Fibrella forsythiae TaxID=2817061 RepID=A0ABS3JEL6_9BACT|nr:hypothetical protein [Fibrella forsythiae]MBO0947729.1 hypothetical protein [Fibrella forsythiae]